MNKNNKNKTKHNKKIYSNKNDTSGNKIIIYNYYMNKLGSDLADAWLNKKLVDLNKFNNNEIPKTREEAYKALNIFYKKLNKKTKSIISIFAGRMADKGKDPLPIFKKSIALTKKNKNIEILWASTREAYNYTQAKQINCDIITMPPKVVNQINSFGKSFKSMTLDTVKSFLVDSKKSRFSL